ncbi:copper resistance CopC family protein [Serinibacter salmoneus]|uniref:CopC domain-containing protein n=1 Tax=Serinibacter salmoneus TaxID=556530 RepID=A0A2A9D267_9MICO|nr:copper resistance CopC family protein [Serinibacter salmoneus]PFG20753.1 hypothetical protein ATL40_2365 [Serinibacter salmoneus]
MSSLTNRAALPTRSLRRLTAALATALVLLVAGPVTVPAHAHDSLVGSSPTDGDVLTQNPGTAVLTFTGEIQEIGTAIEIVGPSGDVAGEPKISGRDVRVPIAADAPSGDYLITWRVTSSDGHPIDGEIPFAMDLPDASASAQEPTTEAGSTEAGTPEASEQTTVATPSATEASTSSEESTDTASDSDDAAAPDVTDLPAWVIALIAVAIVGAVVALLVRMRRSSRFRE